MDNNNFQILVVDNKVDKGGFENEFINFGYSLYLSSDIESIPQEIRSKIDIILFNVDSNPEEISNLIKIIREYYSHLMVMSYGGGKGQFVFGKEEFDNIPGELGVNTIEYIDRKLSLNAVFNNQEFSSKYIKDEGKEEEFQNKLLRWEELITNKEWTQEHINLINEILLIINSSKIYRKISDLEKKNIHDLQVYVKEFSLSDSENQETDLIKLKDKAHEVFTFVYFRIIDPTNHFIKNFRELKCVKFNDLRDLVSVMKQKKLGKVSHEKSDWYKKGWIAFSKKNDWQVDRDMDAINEETGLDDFKLVFMYLNFIRDYREDEIIVLHPGPGDGKYMSEFYINSLLKSSEKSSNYGIENNAKEYDKELDKINHIGIADKYYFDLKDFISKKILKDEYLDNPLMNDFVILLFNILINGMNDYMDGDMPEIKKYKLLVDLERDLNNLKEILLHLNEYISPDMEKYRDGAEFHNEKETFINEDLKHLLVEINDNSQLFARKYFKEEVFLEDHDLHNDIPLYAKDAIIPMYFQEFKQIMPEIPIFDISFPARSTSHLTDDDWLGMIEESLIRLKEGGFLREDGIRESYTRYARVMELKDLLDYGKTIEGRFVDVRFKDKNFRDDRFKDIKVSLVIDDEYNIKSSLIQKGLKFKGPHGGIENVFFDRQNLNNCSNGMKIVLLDELINESPEAWFKCQFLKDIKERIVINNTNYETISRDRDLFRYLNHKLKSEFKSLFESDKWREAKELLDTDSKLFIKRANELMDEIRNIDRIKRKLEPIEDRKQRFLNASQLPIADGVLPILAIPSKDSLPRDINSWRKINVISTPDNQEISDFTEKKEIIEKINKNFLELREIYQKEPINLWEFSDCFTNPSMVYFLEQVFGSNYEQIVRKTSIDLERKGISNLVDEGVVIIGGSTYDVYDDYGKAFLDKVMKKQIAKIRDSNDIRMMGICFGHQLIWQALGYNVKKGALEFGHFPVRFIEDFGKKFTGLSDNNLYSLFFSRSGYVDIPRDTDPELKRKDIMKAYTYGDNYKPGRFLSAIITSLFDDKIITSQAHLEVAITRENQRRALIEAALKIVPSLLKNKNVNIWEVLENNVYPILKYKTDDMEKDPLILADLGPNIFIKQLEIFSDDLLKSAKEKSNSF